MMPRIHKYCFIFFFSSLIFISYLSIHIQCYAQSITWQKTYNSPFSGDDIGNDICQTTDGNFYIAGALTAAPNSYSLIYILKIDKFGDTIWTRAFGNSSNGGQVAYAIAPSDDGGCVFTGAWYESFAMKLDSNGNIVWQRFYGGSQVQCKDMIKSSTGDYVACGFSTAGTTNGYAYKISSNGSLIWQQTFPSGENMTLNCLTQAVDSGYILVGNLQNSLNEIPKALVMKIDAAGIVVWVDTFRVNGLTSLTNIDKTTNYYVVSGQTGNYLNTRTFFSRVDLSGTPIYTKLFVSSRNEYSARIAILNDNSFVVSVLRDSLLPQRVVEVKIIDSSGFTRKQRVFTSTYGMGIVSILPIADTAILYIGYAEYNFTNGADVYCLSTDTNLYAPPPNAVQTSDENQPRTTYLFQNYPNPFNNSTIIRFNVRKASNICLMLYDITGRVLATLRNSFFLPGEYGFPLDATEYASGIYFITLRTGDMQTTKKLILLR